MIQVSEALSIVLSHRPVIVTEEIPLIQAIGRVLAEPVLADRDFPPFDRVTMDGIALAFTEGLPAPIAGEVLLIESTQYAGEKPHQLTLAANAIEVMTGAVLPIGTHAVLRYEDLDVTERDGQRWAALRISPESGQNIHRRGEDRRAGNLLLPVGTRLSPAEIAVAASVGRATLRVQTNPRVAVISTGDELVAVQETPQPYQIRRSNGPMLVAALAQAGLNAEEFHLTDNRAELKNHLHDLLGKYDVLLLSGGVSAGKKDFVPDVLAELGVEKHLHQIAQRPGKPFWFGTKSGGGAAVFALPGNPVSTFLCYQKYVVPFLKTGKNQPERRAILTETVTFKPNLTYFVPVATQLDEQGRLLARPLRGSGSGDFANLLDCDGFLELPAGPDEFVAGEAFGYLGFRV
ncbi:MAG: molybdopterin molybdotransferase MoeA [Cytophagaceae bacterium]|nr:molybdopterin molybdotransferase MoeA [Cytophagaceae bacterium]